MSYDESIHDRLQRGFLTDTREGRVAQFFAAYDTWRMSDDDDALEIQRLEHNAGITAADWEAYHKSFRAEF